MYFVFTLADAMLGQRVTLTITREGQPMPQGGGPTITITAAAPLYQGVIPYTPPLPGLYRAEITLDGVLGPVGIVTFAVGKATFRRWVAAPGV